MKYNIVDTLTLKNDVYDILATNVPQLFTPIQIGMGRYPWPSCARGYTAAYAIRSGKLVMRQAYVGLHKNHMAGYLRTFDPGAGTMERIPAIDGIECTVSEGVACWYGLTRPIYFSGTLVIGVGDMSNDDFELGLNNLGSTVYRDCLELTFKNGKLLSKSVCDVQRMYTLNTPEEQLKQAVEDAQNGEDIMHRLMHNVLPRSWTEGSSCRCALSLRARGPIASEPLYEILASLIDQAREDDLHAHPYGLLLKVLRSLRSGPCGADAPRKWTRHHQVVHERFDMCACLHTVLVKVLSPGAHWSIAKTGICPIRPVGEVCPVDCPSIQRLNQLRQTGSRVRGVNLVRSELGMIPSSCASASM